MPHNSERQNFAVVVQERLQVLIGSATLKHHFDVVLVFSKIWGILLHVYHGAGVDERIIGKALTWSKGHTFVGVEGAGELISIDNSEDTAVEFNISSDLEIAPSVRLD